MKARRSTTLSLVLAVAALAPTVALASNGADDNPAIPDDHGGQVARGTTADDHPSVGEDRTAPSAAGAKGGGSKARRVAGTCSANATAKLKVKPDGGRLETEFEVDQNRSGVRWTVTIRRNGSLAVGTHATTRAPSGSFSVERRLVNGSGSDRISARATSPSGQVCRAALSI